MIRYKMDLVNVSGFSVLFIGVAALLFTFINAYSLLIGVLEIASSEDLMILFGEALAPLISYAIRALYLGIMGWIGSILTRRGVQTITSIPKKSKTEDRSRLEQIMDQQKSLMIENKKKLI